MATMGKVELLPGWLDVMELKSAQPLRVATEDAGATGLPDELLLYFAPALRNCSRPTSLAPVIAPSLQRELGNPMPGAFEGLG